MAWAGLLDKSREQKQKAAEKAVVPGNLGTPILTGERYSGWGEDFKWSYLISFTEDLWACSGLGHEVLEIIF